MRDLTRNTVMVLVLLAAVVLAGGCSYMKDRGKDALDMADVGIFVNPHAKPQFGLFFDFFSIVPLGYSDVDAKVLGIGNRQIGWLDYKDERWGVLAWGSKVYGHNEFDPKDPHQARNDQRDLTERPRFNTGFVRPALRGESVPWPQFIECERMFMLGWIGFHFAPRPIDIVDFLLGWTTLDIVGDDESSR